LYRRILVPMEHQEQQAPALAQARALARDTGATVIAAWLVPVLASGEQFFSQIQVEPGSSGARRKAEGEAYLSRVTGNFRAAGVALETKVIVTALPPEQAIVEMAVEERADLIVMATLPQSAVGRFVFGSVEDKVRRRSPVPVLFVHGSEMEKGEG
jgi:nucleotide-binding universal stress UspA family protein